MIPIQADDAPGRAGRQHVLPVVIEDYFQVGSFSDLIPNAHWERFESRLRTGTAAFLQLLADTGNRATFFTCGWIADHHPEVLREVVAAGHEVAAQGYFQHSVQDISPAAFGADLRRSRDAVEEATGCAVRGHRIGRRWLRVRDLWVLEQIAAAGFAYDSSICPSGREFAALAECETVHRRVSAGGDLFEVPISSHRLAGLHLPIIGGNWFRQSPEWPLRYAARHWVGTRSAPLVAYFHTWEFDAAQPRIAGADAAQALRHYRNLASMPTRVRRWLTDYRFGSVAEHLRFDAAPADAAASRPAAVSALGVSSALPPAAGAPAGAPLTLVIPCFNEVPTLPYLERTLRRFAAARGAGLALSYGFVDDGSSDGSWPLMRSLFADLPRCTLKLNSSNFLTDLRLNGDATVNGSGTILLSNSNNNRIYGDSNAYRLTIGAGQTLRGTGQLGVNQLKITNNGAIVADQTVALTINPTASDPLTNRGTVEVATGSQMTLSGSNLLQDGLAARTVVNGTLTTPLIDLGAGSLSGTGTIIGAVSNSGGAVAPGASPGKLAIQGNYTQGADGSFDVEINGLQQGVEHDWLAITGSASLAGSLRLNFGYTPILGSSFVILTSGGLRTGTFSSLIQPSGWDLVATYNPHDVTLTVAAVPEPETYALMFAGLALVGFSARRRKAASIA